MTIVSTSATKATNPANASSGFAAGSDITTSRHTLIHRLEHHVHVKEMYSSVNVLKSHTTLPSIRMGILKRLAPAVLIEWLNLVSKELSCLSVEDGPLANVCI